MPSGPILIYDGDCSFCSTSIRFLKKKLPINIKMEPYQLADLKVLELTVEECRREVQFIDYIGRRSSGAAAFANLFRLGSKPWKLLSRVMKFPVIRVLADVVYHWVATNRYRLPGGTPTCRMPRND